MRYNSSVRPVTILLACLVLCTTTALGSTPQERLRDFDRDLNRTLHRIATADLASCEAARATAGTFEAELRLLRAEIPELASKFDALSPLVGNLRRAAETLCSVRTSRADGELQTMRSLLLPPGIPRVDKAIMALPGSDTCETAPLIAFGSYTGSLLGTTLDGSTGCGGQGSGDVWYRVDSPSYLRFLVDTFGSDFDTVVSVHLECPGTTSNQIACDDDTAGLQSALLSEVSANQSVWIRISSFDGIGGQYQLNYGIGGSIAGTVTAEADGAPLEGAQVSVYHDYSFVGSVTTDADGSYSAPTSSLHYEGFKVRASGSEDYIDEVYQDQPCISPCDRELGNTGFGQEVTPPASGTAAGIDFALSPAARIAGTITDTSGTGLRNIEVELWDDLGEQLHQVFSAADGSYAFTRLPAGKYFVRSHASSFVNEVYDGQACAHGLTANCILSRGTVIPVAVGQSVTGIDMQLGKEGSISGTVVDQDGTPISSASVKTQTPDGTLISQVSTDSQGHYEQQGLAAGEYLVLVGRNGFSSQYYDGLPCGFLGNESCDLASATRITVQADTETAGIDFQLNNTGRISGSIRDTDNYPLADIRIYLRTSEPSIRDSTYTDALGQYEFDGLGEGTYYVMAGGNGYVWEIYPDGPCLGNNGTCEFAEGTGIEMTLGAHRSGIDLQLQEGGRLFGRITDTTGAPLHRWGVYAFDPNTIDYNLAFALTDINGNYVLEHLPPTPVYLKASRCSGCSSEYINEIYPNVHCLPDRSCPITDGLRVTPQVETSLGSFDFQIGMWTTFTGTIYDSETGGKARYTEIRLWDENGNQVDWARTSSGNPFTLRGASGKFTVTAASDSYHGEVFDDIACPFNGRVPTCDVTTGTVFNVSTDQQITDIDFVLEPRGVLTGRLVSAVDGSGVASRLIEAWDLQPSPFSPPSVYTDADGYFRFTGLVGTFTVSTDPPSNAIPTLFDGILCPLGVSSYYSRECEPAKGKPIVIGANQAAPSILMMEYPQQVGLYGYVTDETSGDGLAGVAVDIWNAQDSTLAATATTDANGHYYQALSVGTYFVSTRNSPGHVEQVYVGVACLAGSAFYGPCQPNQGYTLDLTGNIPIRADFALTPREVLKRDGFESGTLDGWTVEPALP